MDLYSFFPFVIYNYETVQVLFILDKLINHNRFLVMEESITRKEDINLWYVYESTFNPSIVTPSPLSKIIVRRMIKKTRFKSIWYLLRVIVWWGSRGVKAIRKTVE